MTVYIVRESINAFHPGDIVVVFSDLEEARNLAARPCGYVNGDRSRPVPSGYWIDEREVCE